MITATVIFCLFGINNAWAFHKHHSLLFDHRNYPLLNSEKVKKLDDKPTNLEDQTEPTRNVFGSLTNGADLPDLGNILNDDKKEKQTLSIPSIESRDLPDFIRNINSTSNTVPQKGLLGNLGSGPPITSAPLTLVTGEEFANDIFAQSIAPNQVNSRNVRQNAGSSTTTTNSPFRFHIDTEDGSSKTEESGGAGQLQLGSKLPLLNQKPQLNLLRTGLSTAVKTAQNVGTFVRSEFDTLGDAAKETAESFGLGNPLGTIGIPGLTKNIK